MSSLFQRFMALPGYSVGALVVLLLYGIQSEIRFGTKARTMVPGSADRGSTLALSLAAAVPVLGFVLAMKAQGSLAGARLPSWFVALPGIPTIGWVGVGIGASGLVVRMWSVLTLRDRYTRTLVTKTGQAMERSGPYRFVRHPGYLGSLLCLNGIAMASGDLSTLIASLAATLAAYAYRIRVEDAMLAVQFGASYRTYCGEVGALMPLRSFWNIPSAQNLVNKTPSEDRTSLPR